MSNSERSIEKSIDEQVNLNPGKKIKKGELVLPLVETMIPYIQILYERKKLFIVSLLIIGLISFAILWFVVPTQYESKIVILPSESSASSSSALGSLTGLASAAGINIGTSSLTGVYEKLVYTEAILEPVVFAKYPSENPKDSVTLLDYFGYKPDPELPIAREKRKLFLDLFEILTEEGRITTDLDASTSILTITVTLNSSKMAALVANNITSSLDNFVRTKRKSSASNTRKYLEERTNAISDSLKAAEEKLKSFRQQNRVIATPEMMLEQSRLSRKVDLLGTQYLNIVNQLEAAKLAEVKDVPVVDYVEYARDSINGTGPHRFIFLVVILFLTTIILGFYVIFKDAVVRYFREFISKPA